MPLPISFFLVVLVYSNDELPQKSSRSSWASKLDAPPLVPLESFFSSHVHPLYGNPYSSHHIFHMTFSRLWLSSLMWAFHTFFSSFPIIILFRHLSVNFLAYAHPLHECSKSRKGVDQFDLYLTSGPGLSEDKIPKDTKEDKIKRSQRGQMREIERAIEATKKKERRGHTTIPFERSTLVLHLLSLVLHRDHHHSYSYVGTLHTIELGLYIPMMSLLKRALGLLEQAS